MVNESKSSNKFVKIEKEIFNLGNIAHLRWADEDEETLHVTTVSGEILPVEASIAKSLYGHVRRLADFTLDESELPVRLFQSLTGTSGQPHTQLCWGNEIRWSPIDRAYYITESLGPYSNSTEEYRVIFRQLHFEASERDWELYGGAHELSELTSQQFYKWEEKGYLLRLRNPGDYPPIYIMQRSIGGIRRTLGFMMLGVGISSGEHFTLEVYTKNEEGELQIVPNGEIKIFVD